MSDQLFTNPGDNTEQRPPDEQNNNTPVVDMQDTTEPQIDAAGAPDEQPGGDGPGPQEPPQRNKNAAKRKKRKKVIKLVVGLTVLVLVVGGIAGGMYWLFTREKPVHYVTEHIYRGMLETAVQGWGVLRPEESAEIVVLHRGKVLESFCAMGDMVMEGDLLFIMDSDDIDKEIEDHYERIAEVEKKIDKINSELNVLLGDEAERRANLTVSTPFKGHLIEASSMKVGDYVTTGEKVGLLVDDATLTLSLYFSYAYEHSIRTGQTAEISIPGVMSVITGHVSKINLVRRMSPEGAALFEAVISLENPGALTAGMDASAVIRAESEDIYPSISGQLDYSRAETLIIKAPGRLTYANVIDYMDYAAGETLCRIEYKEDNAQVDTMRQQIEVYRQDIEDIEEEIKLSIKGYDDLSVTAPMSGTVLHNNLVPGESVEPGLVITIAKLNKMMVDAQVDERQVSQVRPGMPVEVSTWVMDGQIMLFGVVKSVNLMPNDNSMMGGMGGAVTYYPAVFEIENYSGMLMTGQYMDYRLVVEQRFDILVAPVIAVKNTEQGTCVFVRSEERPTNAIDLDDGIVPPGFFAVPVECGIGNENGIEIMSGVEEGAEVFTQIIPLDQLDQGGGMRGGGGVIYYG